MRFAMGLWNNFLYPVGVNNKNFGKLFFGHGVLDYIARFINKGMMKKLLIVSAMSLGFMACDKNYVCKCTTNSAKIENTEFEVNSLRKKEATTKCREYQERMEATFAGESYECRLQ